MSVFQKNYRIPKRCINQLMRMLHQYIGTFNKEKIGRNRRGSVVMCGCDTERESNGDFGVTVIFERRGAPYINVVGHEKIKAFNHTDFKKLFKTLRKLEG